MTPRQLVLVSAVAAFALAALPAPVWTGISSPAGLHAQTVSEDAGDFAFREHRLDNGLHLILAPDPAATAVAVNLWYDVGSRHEEPGRSGFAHLFEHLMFQGSENVPPAGHPELIERVGGNLNASASEDRTNFYQTVPPERVNLALWLEAERMRSLAVTGPNMAREVEVVKEERRLRVDNAPYATSRLQAAYYAPYDSTTCFAYAHSTIGSMRDLDAAEISDARTFYERYYGPDNATLTVAGRFDPDTVLGLVRDYFGPIEARGPAEPVACDAPFSSLPVERVVDDPNAVLPAVFVSFGTVRASDPDAPPLQVLARILASGESSRLHRRLVREESAALSVEAYSAARVEPGIFLVSAIANQGVAADRLLELLQDELSRVARDGVSDTELLKARNQLQSGIVFARQTVMGRAEALQSANHFHGSPGAAMTELDRIQAVTAEDVRRVAGTYLTPENRASIRTRPVSEIGGSEATRP